jgi:hypothetical protein
MAGHASLPAKMRMFSSDNRDFTEDQRGPLCMMDCEGETWSRIFAS